MKMEIERKFLVTGDGWRAIAGAGQLCEQGYISSGENEVTVRVRQIGEKGYLTLKGMAKGISRPEVEYEIPVDEAKFMLQNFCGDRIVSKTRYLAEIEGLIWEIDEFSGLNQGLIVAEIELKTETTKFSKPGWLGKDVSLDWHYTNASLAEKPYLKW